LRILSTQQKEGARKWEGGGIPSVSFGKRLFLLLMEKLFLADNLLFGLLRLFLFFP
jgi:hypothetical protein